MLRIFSVYTLFGISAALTAIITFQIIFFILKNYHLSSRYSYIIAALVSFLGNLKYGFKVDMNIKIALIWFPLIVFSNLFILKKLSDIYNEKKINSINASFLNSISIAIVNLIFYTLISKISQFN